VTGDAHTDAVDTSAGDGVYSGALVNPSTTPVAEGLPSQAQVLEALKVVKDPEIPVNVVDLGLIYGVDISTAGNVEITMTLTSVGCPVQDLIRADAEMAVMRLDGINQVRWSSCGRRRGRRQDERRRQTPDAHVRLQRLIGIPVHRALHT